VSLETDNAEADNTERVVTVDHFRVVPDPRAVSMWCTHEAYLHFTVIIFVFHMMNDVFRRSLADGTGHLTPKFFLEGRGMEPHRSIPSEPVRVSFLGCDTATMPDMNLNFGSRLDLAGRQLARTWIFEVRTCFSSFPFYPFQTAHSIDVARSCKFNIAIQRTGG
jgi:hypothetical protein